LITSPHNEKLKLIRKLRSRRERDRSGLFLAEGEDLVAAAKAAGAEPELLLVAGEDVAPELLDAVSALGSGTRVIGVYRQRWVDPGGEVSVYLHGVGDPGNVGTIIRAAHALCDGPVVLGASCADPYSPKAVRASMGSVFARPPARGDLIELAGTKVALDGGAEASLEDLELAPPMVLCLGAERAGLEREVAAAVDASARIPMRSPGPDSLNVAMAATIALYEVNTRMAARA
jgi:RNA methyltransferase, TrmH family